jgi:hypothetical protein
MVITEHAGFHPSRIREELMDTNTRPQSGYTPMDDSVLHHAALIDHNGNEVEITAGMIDQACDTMVLNQGKLDADDNQPPMIVERFGHFSRRLLQR